LTSKLLWGATIKTKTKKMSKKMKRKAVPDPGRTLAGVARVQVIADHGVLHPDKDNRESLRLHLKKFVSKG